MSRLLVALLALFLAAFTPQPAPDLDTRAKDIEAALIAPCCFRQQVSVHSSPAADEVRRDVRARLATGQSRDEILDAYVAQYGQRILAEPPAEGAGALLQIAPFLMAFAGLLLLVLIVRHLTGGTPLGMAASPSDARPTPLDETRLDDELRDMD